MRDTTSRYRSGEIEIGILFLEPLQQRSVLKAITQAKRSVVMKVIVDEHVVGRSLFAGGLQRWMRLQQSLA